MASFESRRLELHEILCDILGSRNVYFQPPESIKMHYPSIVYNRADIDSKKADDKSYVNKVKYYITIINHDPDAQYVNELLELPYCSFDRSYVYDNLNHDTLIIYY